MRNRLMVVVGTLVILFIGVAAVAAIKTSGFQARDHSSLRPNSGETVENHIDHKTDEADKHKDHADHEDHGEGDDHTDHEDHGEGDDHADHGEVEEHADHEDHEDHAEGGNANSDEHGHEKSGELIRITDSQKTEANIVIGQAVPGKITRNMTFVGEVRLNEDRLAHLVPKVGGVVSSVNVSLGDVVHEGDVLAVIDSPEFAEIKVDFLEKGRALEVAMRTYNRKNYLKKENIASEADWFEAQANYHNAKTAARSAKRRLVILGLTKQEIDGLADSKDEVFGQYKLKSPLNGVVIAKHIARGEKIGDEEVFFVADLSELWVDLQVPAKDIGYVKKDIDVRISSTEGLVAEGKILLIGPTVNEQSRTVLARVNLSNKERLWKPGVFVKGQIEVSTPEYSVVIESEAVQQIGGSHVVFIPESGGFKSVKVSLGKRGTDKVQIMEGLRKDEKYVAKGAFEIKAVKVTSGSGGHAGHGH